MSASPPNPRFANDGAEDHRVRWLAAPALRLHAAMLTGVALAGVATWLEWTRARTGHSIAWVYTFEWPLFAVLGICLWWRLLHADARPQAGRPPENPQGEDAADPDLLAWQAYLARLHEADPPGGPPVESR
jgi:hypothetical protein